MFTATKSADPKLCSLDEDPVLWPTYQNVTSSFNEITSLANTGDFVYIHYSGHGNRTQFEPHNEFSNRSTGDLALILLDGEKENHVRPLWGSRLAIALKAMVDKGLVVTLVLDCCFSATVYRGDNPTVRFLPYSAKIDTKYQLSSEKSLGDGADRLANRDASMLPNWLINPDGYAILIACGLNEFAKEYTEDEQSYGLLSYFLLRTFIECSGIRKRHKDVYHQLCARFRESWPQQKPILYGNKDQGFFGHPHSEVDIAPISIVERDGSL